VSNFLAVAQATQALCRFIERTVQDDLGVAVPVRPGKPLAEPATEPTITVFLYQVTPNGALRNRDAPARTSEGTLLTRPQNALDLHYVISFYGNELQLDAQRMLGSVERSLYEQPVLSRQDIEDAATELPVLAGGDLAASPQRVRLTPTKMDVDELSKLWSTLFQTPYALSVVYEATAVLLDGHGAPAAGKPVLERAVRAVAGGGPVVERLLSRPVGSPDRPVEGPVPRDHEIWLVGHRLAVGARPTVRVGDLEFVPSEARDDRVVFTLPDALPEPGVHPVTVVHDAQVGEGGQVRPLPRAVESNAMALVRQPRITEATVAGAAPRTVTVRLDVDVAGEQRVELLLDELDPPAGRAPGSHRFAAAWPLAPPGRPANQVQVDIGGVPPATYLVAVEVDGVSSRPAPDLRTPALELGE
jgi:hypothetical protein